MTVQIQSLHFNADKKLLDFVEERVEKLTLFYDSILNSEVTLRLDKADNAENKIAEVKLHIPGNDLFSKKQCKTFEEAIDLCVDALKTQIRKQRKKVKGAKGLTLMPDEE